MLRYSFLLFLFIGFNSLVQGQVTLHSESFETDGEGTRYTSNTFVDCTSQSGQSDFFVRTNTNPVQPPTCPDPKFGSTLTNLQGTYFWASEDIRTSNPNPNSLPPGNITTQQISVVGYNTLKVSLFLATSNNNGVRWESSDSINIKVKFDGGGEILVGRFMGSSLSGGNLIIDANLNGVYDSGSESSPLCDIANFTKYTFNISGTGTNMQVILDYDQAGGTEELAIDLIEVTGLAAPGACPNTNPNFFCASYNASSLTLNNRTHVCDLVAGEYQDIVLTSGNTYRLDFCGIGSNPAPSYNSLLTVYSPSNTLVGFNDDFCGDDSQFDFVAPSSGTYKVLANISGNCGATNFIFTPLAITLLASASAPEINVRGNGISINDEDTSPTTGDNTSFGSVAACFGTIVKSFFIKNSGSSNLTVSSINFSGSHGSDFTLTTAPSSSILPGDSSSFQVTFNPSAVGLRTATINIVNNDGNENPYNFSIEGTGSVSPLTAMISGTTILNCFGDNNGSLTVTVSNGTANYNYVWSNASSTNNSPLATNTINSLSFGTFNVTVTDANGCSATSTHIISQPTTLNLSRTITNVLCIGGSTGAINLTVSGATPDYSYLWSNSATTEDISTLLGGTYTVTVTDLNGCTGSTNATVTTPGFTISGNNIIIVDNDNSPSTLDGTDFETQAINSSTPQTFIFANSSLAISLNSINSSASQFTLSSVPPNLTSNGVEDFIVTYSPTTSGVHISDIEVYYNGCASPYNFIVTGSTCTGNDYTFIGPGTDPMLSSNWLNGCIPPMNNVNTIVTIQSGSTLVLTGNFAGDIINNGTLKGSLNLNGNITNNGFISPGN